MRFAVFQFFVDNVLYSSGGQLQCGRRISNCDWPTLWDQSLHPFCLHTYPWYTG